MSLMNPSLDPSYNGGGGVTYWMTCQGAVGASTRGGPDAYLLAQHMDGWMDSAYSLWIASWFLLAVISSMDEALRELGTFAFVASHLFYAGGGQHAAAVAELFRPIEKLEELHIEVQGMITSPHLATTLIYDVLWRC